MGLFDRLFGRGGGQAVEEAAGPTAEHKGYTIHPAPRRQGGGWLVAGSISKAFPDGVKEHAFVRADTFAGRDEAVAFSVTKAKQIIDERGDRMFAAD